MRTVSDLFPLLAALKEMHRELQSLRDEVKELKCVKRGLHLQVVLPPPAPSEGSDETSSECDSVQSAPAIVSHVRESDD